MVRKVLHVYNDFQPENGGGGVARHIAGLAESVANQGMQVRVVAQVADAAPTGSVYQVERAGWAAVWRHVGWADVVHVHGARKPFPAWAAGIAALRGSRRIVYTPHCYYDDDTSLLKQWTKRLWDATVERWLLWRSDAVVLLSDYWRRYLSARRLGVSHPVVVPNCVVGREVVARRQTGVGKLEGEPALLSVGRLDKVKRLDDAIRALTHPALAHAVLHIVGRGPDEARLSALAHELDVVDRVRFHGFVNDAGVAGMAAAADVFVMPSAAEGMPTVLIEMLLMGLPVVASDIPGNRAILDRVGLDVLFPVADVSRMVERIAQVIDKPLEENVARAVQEHFTWEQAARRIAVLYQEGEVASC